MPNEPLAPIEDELIEQETPQEEPRQQKPQIKSTLKAGKFGKPSIVPIPMPLSQKATSAKQKAEVYEPIKLKVSSGIMHNDDGFFETKHTCLWQLTDRRIIYETNGGKSDINYDHIVQISTGRGELSQRVRISLGGVIGALIGGIISWSFVASKSRGSTGDGDILVIMLLLFMPPLVGYVVGSLIEGIITKTNMLPIPRVRTFYYITLKTVVGSVTLTGTESEISHADRIIREGKEGVIKVTTAKEVHREVLGTKSKVEEIKDAIDKLAKLAGDGYITMEEFKKKKQELLDQL